MSTQRVNTLKISFENIKQRPSSVRIHQWLQSTLNLNVDQVLSIEIDYFRKCVYVKLLSAFLCEKVLNNIGSVLSYEDEDGTHDVLLSLANTPTVFVRIHVVPMELSHAVIRDALSVYGPVLSITDEVYSSEHVFPIRTGRTLLKMTLRKPIPSYVNIQSGRYWVTYMGQIKTCAICDSDLHYAAQCDKRISALPVRASPNYAAKLVAPPPSATVTPPPLESQPITLPVLPRPLVPTDHLDRISQHEEQSHPMGEARIDQSTGLSVSSSTPDNQCDSAPPLSLCCATAQSTSVPVSAPSTDNTADPPTVKTKRLRKQGIPSDAPPKVKKTDSETDEAYPPLRRYLPSQKHRSDKCSLPGDNDPNVVVVVHSENDEILDS